jgi:hypothetical protein
LSAALLKRLSRTTRDKYGNRILGEYAQDGI